MVLHIDMHVLEHTYISLLADVASLSGFSEIRGSYLGLQWCLYEAPKLEKLLLASIESGQVPDLDLYPTALRRLVAGSVIDPVLLRLLRQLLLFCYKAYVTHDKDTTEKTFQGFLDTNRDVNAFGHSLSRLSPTLLNIARQHCQSVLYRFREKALAPSHGPGAVTTSKTQWQHMYSTINSIYPYSDLFYVYQNVDHLAEYDMLEHRHIIQAKLIAVPKDSRGPRLICVHPAEAIWAQQSVRRELERVISLKRRELGPWPRGRIWFKDQSVNGRIALSSSRTRRYATLDMKEASDRISDVLVQILFGRKYKYFGCSRAQEFIIPHLGGLTNVKGQINCYAPMGNATTFPVQSLVFWAIGVAALQYYGFHQPGAVFVFGDDIIVPTEAAECVVNALESFGLLVNRTKSFWRGAFRESCGVDAFNGVDVTPIRWKTTIDAEHAMGLLSLSDLAMRLRMAGYEEAATTTYQTLRGRLRTRYGKDLFLTNNPRHGGIAEFTTNDANAFYDACWHRGLQWYQSRVWHLEALDHKVRGHHWNDVLESLTSLERRSNPYFNGMSEDRIDPDGPPSRGVRLNRGWIPVL